MFMALLVYVDDLVLMGNEADLVANLRYIIMTIYILKIWGLLNIFFGH